MHNKTAAGRVARELERACDAETVKAVLSAYPHIFNYGQWPDQPDQRR